DSKLATRSDDYGSLDLQPKPVRLPVYLNRACPGFHRRRKLVDYAAAFQRHECARLRSDFVDGVVCCEEAWARSSPNRSLSLYVESAGAASSHSQRTQRHSHRVLCSFGDVLRSHWRRVLDHSDAGGGYDAQVWACDFASVRAHIRD